MLPKKDNSLNLTFFSNYRNNDSVMKKMLPVFLVTLCILVLAALVPLSFAQDEGKSSIAFPPTSEGPGMILPDSPFYFLDQLKQNVRLAFAVTPTQKAHVYSSVAGERIAELRFELAKNNITAAEVAVRGIRENTANAAKAVNEAKLWGTDISDLAKEINLSIREHQQQLDTLENQSSGALKAEVYIAQAALSDAKTTTSLSLPKDQAENEIANDLQRNSLLKASIVLENAIDLKKSLEALQNQATKAANPSKNGKGVKKENNGQQQRILSQVEDIVKKAQDVKDLLEASYAATTPTPTSVEK